jgi:putative NIF3 family GTP cyclohydrolase 1 type 2
VLEDVEEVRLEMAAPRRAVGKVVRAMIGAHPYEEVAYDVYPLDNTSSEYGMGTIGSLGRSVPLRQFLATVRSSLGAPALRWTGDPRSSVQKIALCGGSGSDLLPDAVRSGADVFVTADVRYHTYQEAEGTIALVDAGHYETEIPVVASVVARLRREIQSRGERIPVRAASQSTNPVRGHM